MSLQAIYAALDGLFAAIEFPPARVIQSNATFQPTAGQPYLVASNPAYVRRALTLGVDKSLGGAGGYLAEHRGTYRVTAVWPQNAGTAGGFQLQQQVLLLFPRGTTLTSSAGDQVVLDAPTPAPYYPDEAWYRFPVDCPWFCFENS